MKAGLLLSALLAISLFIHAQNLGVGELAPISKLEVKADGNTNSTNSLLIKNSDNSRLFFLNGSGSATFGNALFASPGHLVGIHNGLQPSRAHLALYATGGKPTDPGSVNRIGFSNVSNGFHQFEIQSYSGREVSEHSLSFRYLDFNTSPVTETRLLQLNANGSTIFSGTVFAPGFSSSSIVTPNLIINSGEGEPYDFLIKENASGEVSARKGHGALGLNYIICIQGAGPTYGPGPASNAALLGEVRLWAGDTPPQGWAFCHGQMLPVSGNNALFLVLGVNYGGNGTTTFALPDLRGAVPVQQGSPPVGGTWTIGERSF